MAVIASTSSSIATRDRIARCLRNSKPRGAIFHPVALSTPSPFQTRRVKCRRAEIASCRAAFGTYPLFAASTLYVLPYYFSMILFPKSSWTRELVTSERTLLPLAAIYCYLLISSWRPDTLQLMMPGNVKEGLQGFNPQFFPKLDAIRILFSRLTTAASLWVHVVCVNLFFARTIFLEGIAKNIPTWHSCLIAMFVGPVAILSAYITDLLFSQPQE